jgi:hypothetical protein
MPDSVDLWRARKETPHHAAPSERIVPHSEVGIAAAFEQGSRDESWNVPLASSGRMRFQAAELACSVVPV